MARPPLARLPPRRRKLERKPLRQLATRRREIRPERKLTPHTSTKVQSLPSAHLAALAFAHHPFYPTFLPHSQLCGIFANSSTFSPQASSPRYRYLKPCYVYSELVRQWYVFIYSNLHSNFRILILFNQTSSSASQPKHQSSLPTTRSLLFHLERFKPRM